ncbi:hypothetical protein [Xanthomonas sp. D-109]|uniref:hypothetical protein n=1 Tax=Xanthomonas sp. D-109 TaxID=2821274 RepID=UPI001ADD024B|nr:hypothetical protein [Xanthomonas sp. D-109]MBO9880979.1 hypothetical protein [Xanthomonas sp. D-109]
MSIYSDLLFHHGHIADVALAQSLVAPGKAPPASADARPQDPEAAAMRTCSEQQPSPACAAAPTEERLSPFR